MPKAVAVMTSGNDANVVVGSGAYCARRHWISWFETNGSISMKPTFGAPVVPVSTVLLTGFSRAPMNSVSRRNGRQATGNARAVLTNGRNRRAPAIRYLSSMRSSTTAWFIMLFCSWIQTPHGFAKGFDVSGNINVWNP